jgi:DNA-binding MarR family transcriptional regulator
MSNDQPKGADRERRGAKQERGGRAQRGGRGQEGGHGRPQLSSEWARGQSEERAALLTEFITANRAYQSAVEKMDEAFCRVLGVNRTDGRCLDVIDQRPGLTAGELATAVGLSPGAVTTVLDRLEQRGFVRRIRDSEDRRRVMVELTEEANRVAWEAYGPLGQMGAPLIEKMSDKDLETLIRFLRGGTEINELRAQQLLDG